jgi:hypothetical protein
LKNTTGFGKPANYQSLLWLLSAYCPSRDRENELIEGNASESTEKYISGKWPNPESNWVDSQLVAPGDFALSEQPLWTLVISWSPNQPQRRGNSELSVLTLMSIA